MQMRLARADVAIELTWDLGDLFASTAAWEAGNVDLELERAIFGELRAFGVRISLDDFGTGYSSLSYLQSLPLDTLKIDRSFVSGIGTDEDKGGIIKLIVGLALTLDLDRRRGDRDRGPGRHRASAASSGAELHFLPSRRLANGERRPAGQATSAHAGAMPRSEPAPATSCSPPQSRRLRAGAGASRQNRGTACAERREFVKSHGGGPGATAVWRAATGDFPSPPLARARCLHLAAAQRRHLQPARRRSAGCEPRQPAGSDTQFADTTPTLLGGLKERARGR
jgi:hypothetical protein